MKFYAIQFRIDEGTVKTLLLRNYTELFFAKAQCRRENREFKTKVIIF